VKLAKITLPLWLKIFLIFSLLGLVATLLGPLAPAVFLPVLFIVLIAFPGKDHENPTLFKVIPYLWTLGFAMSVVILVLLAMGRPFPGSGEVTPPSALELWSGILIYPPTMWSFLKRHRSFKPILLAGFVIAVVVSLSDFSDSVKDVRACLDLIGGLGGELILTPYLYWKFKPEPRTPR
jgi:hypothetical protein